MAIDIIYLPTPPFLSRFRVECRTDVYSLIVYVVLVGGKIYDLWEYFWMGSLLSSFIRRV